MKSRLHRLAAAAAVTFSIMLLLGFTQVKEFTISAESFSEADTVGLSYEASASSATIISSGPYEITTDGTYQLDAGFAGAITIRAQAGNVKIIGANHLVAHADTSIYAAPGRYNALNLTIENLNISSPTHGIDFGAAGNYQHHLYISGDNTIQGGTGAGIKVDGSNLNIDKAFGLIDGEANLTSIGGTESSGIGGTKSGNGGNIAIKGGTIIAKGDQAASGWGAGIGGGSSGSGGNLTITGGNVTAIGSYYGAGIGGGGTASGSVNNGGSVTISGGTVTARGGKEGAGIGGGRRGDGGGTVIEGNAIVTAEGGADAAGIGGGLQTWGVGGWGGYIIIRSGKVIAVGSAGGAGIGGGRFGAGGNITISGGEVTATGNGGAGIGGGAIGTGGSILISGGIVDSSSSGMGAGIGGGAGAKGGSITIEGGIVSARGNFRSAGIGGGGVNIEGMDGSGGTIVIRGNAIITATGGADGAAIGGGSSSSGGNITITGSTITANGGSFAAGIGGGYTGSGGNITIGGGNVTAAGKQGGSGIGGGASGAGGTVSIYGGPETIVNATGSSWGCAVGSGSGNYTGGTLSVDDGAILNLNAYNTNAGVSFINCTIGGNAAYLHAGTYLSGKKHITLKDFTVNPANFANALANITLSVKVDKLSYTTPQGRISFKANGVEIASASITRSGQVALGSASISSSSLPAGTYTFTAEYLQSDIESYYATEGLQITAYNINRINQAALSISIPNPITYGDDPFSINVSGGSGTGDLSYRVVSGAAVEVSSDGVAAIKGAGTVEIEVLKAADGYHNAASIRIIVIVNKALPTVAFPSAGNIIYGQSIGEAELKDGVGDGSFTWKHPDAIPQVNNDGYIMEFIPNDTVNYDYSGIAFERLIGITVEKKALTVRVNNVSKVYGDEDPLFTVDYISFVNGDSAEDLEGTLVIERQEGEAVNEYIITPSGHTSSNYEIFYETGMLEIERSPVTITADSASKVYGASEPDLTYRITAGALVGEDSVSGALSRAAGETVGSYKIQQGTLTLGGNYEITFEEGVLEINQKLLMVNGTEVHNKVYDGTDEVTISGATLEGVIDDDQVVLGTHTIGALAQISVGEDIVVTTNMTISGDSAFNYCLEQPTGLKGQIVPKELNAINVVAQHKIYDGNTDAVITSAQLDGIAGADDVELDALIGGFADSNAGEDIEIMTSFTLKGSQKSNYILVQPDYIKANILPKELTVINSLALDKIYDGNRDVEISGAELEGIIGDDEVILDAHTVGSLAQSTVGSNIEVSTSMVIEGAEAANYLLLQPIGLTANITPRALTIRAENKKKLQGAPEPEFTVSFDGLAAGDNEGSFEGLLVFEREEGEELGLYNIMPSGLTSLNYDINFEDGVLRIVRSNAKLISLSLESLTLNPSFSSEVTGYTVSVGNSTSSTRVSAAAEDERAVVRVNNEILVGSQLSSLIQLSIGSNIISIEVTAEDGETVKAYTITVTRASRSSTGGGGSTSPVNPTEGVPEDKGYTAETTAGSEKLFIDILYSEEMGNAEVKMDEEQLKELFESALEDDRGIKTVRLSMPKMEGTKLYALEVELTHLSANAADKEIHFETPFGTIAVPNNMLAGMEGLRGEKAEISIGLADKSSLPEDVRSAIGEHPLIQLTLLVDGQSVKWDNPDSIVSVSVPYLPTADELKNHEYLVVWYIDNDGKIIPVPSGRYNSKTGSIEFKTTHFSYYAIAYEHNVFKDTEGVAWAKKPIEVLASKGILKGTLEGEYEPQEKITRADFLYFLINTLGISAEFDENFDDIGSKEYYYKEIGIAKALGIAKGTGDNKFSPEASISRQDMMVLTQRALLMQKIIKQEGNAAELKRFRDKELVADYAVESVASVVKEGLIIGAYNRLNPLGNLTRAEAAVFLYRIYNRIP